MKGLRVDQESGANLNTKVPLSLRRDNPALANTAMVVAHSAGDWPRGIDPEKKNGARVGILKRIYGKKG